MRRPGPVAAILAVLASFVLVPAVEAKRIEDVDRRLRTRLVESMRAYLDRSHEFHWQQKKQLLAAMDALRTDTGIDALQDIPFLRSLIYQGRHFEPRMSDLRWRKANQISDFQRTSGTYLNLKSEAWRLTYSLPKSYPKKDRDFEKIPRPDPYPLVVAIHESKDELERGNTARFPGEVCLKRRYPKGTFGAIYDKWLMLAPVSARGKFLEDDGRVRHRYLTQVITEFWRHYHVDFDRIVIDGHDAVAALLAAFPVMFAGAVLRPGTVVDADVVRNYASVPIYVWGDERLAATLKNAGHPDVTQGTDDDALFEWLEKRERAVPSNFIWRVKNADHLYANWVSLTLPGSPTEGATLSVRVLDTEAVPNTIRIDAAGVEKVTLYLNDRHADLDRKVVLRLNEEVRPVDFLERQLDQVFARPPNVRENMNFGWLYPVVVENVEMPQRGQHETLAGGYYVFAQKAESNGDVETARRYYQMLLDLGDTTYREAAEFRLAELPTEPAEPTEPADEPDPSEGSSSRPRDIWHAARLAAQRHFLYGRLDTLEDAMREEVGTIRSWGPDLSLVLAVRDLWWRRPQHASVRTRYGELAKETKGMLAKRYRWLLGGGEGPYPAPSNPRDDPWRVLTALVRDRQYRETTGHAHLPGISPLAKLRPPAEWREWWSDWKAYYVDALMQDGYEGAWNPASMSPAELEAEEDARRHARGLKTRNRNLAIGVGLGFVLLVLLLGRALISRLPGRP